MHTLGAWIQNKEPPYTWLYAGFANVALDAFLRKQNTIKDSPNFKGVKPWDSIVIMKTKLYL
jgi:hypothetical protein